MSLINYPKSLIACLDAYFPSFIIVFKNELKNVKASFVVFWGKNTFTGKPSAKQT